MAKTDPFYWVAESAQKRVFVFFLIMTLIVGVSLQVLGGPLATDAAPSGILSFEFAGTLNNAQRIIASWGATERVLAGLNLGLDYLFLVFYASSIGLGCAIISRSLFGRIGAFASAGVILAWAQIIAACLDALENYALIRVLLGSERALWPAVARWSALPKFLLVAAGLLYVISGAVLVLAASRGRKPDHVT